MGAVKKRRKKRRRGLLIGAKLGDTAFEVNKKGSPVSRILFILRCVCHLSCRPPERSVIRPTLPAFRPANRPSADEQPLRGVYLAFQLPGFSPADITARPRELLPRDFTLTRERAVSFLWHCPSPGACAFRCPCFHKAGCSLLSGLSSLLRSRATDRAAFLQR